MKGRKRRVFSFDYNHLSLQPEFTSEHLQLSDYGNETSYTNQSKKSGSK